MRSKQKVIAISILAFLGSFFSTQTSHAQVRERTCAIHKQNRGRTKPAVFIKKGPERKIRVEAGMMQKNDSTNNYDVSCGPWPKEKIKKDTKKRKP